MCESFFQVEEPATPDKTKEEKGEARPPEKETPAEPAKKGETKPEGPLDDEVGPARAKDDQTGEEGEGEEAKPPEEESWTDEEEPEEEADWDDTADEADEDEFGDLSDEPEFPIPDDEGPDRKPSAKPPAARAARPREPERDLADSALTLVQDITKPYRHTSLIELSRQPTSKVQVAALLLMVVFFLGLFTTATYAWRGYSWDDPMAGDGLNTLQLTVHNDTGTELKEAQVRIEALSIHAESNDHGLVVLHNLPSGDHVVLISKDGFNTVRMMVTLRSSTDTQKPVSMIEGDEDEIRTLDFREATDLPSAGMLYLLAVVFLLGSLAAFMAASFAFQRIRYRLSMGCAVAAILSYGFLLGSALSFAALVLLILTPYEFQVETEPDAVAGSGS